MADEDALTAEYLEYKSEINRVFLGWSKAFSNETHPSFRRYSLLRTTSISTSRHHDEDRFDFLPLLLPAIGRRRTRQR